MGMFGDIDFARYKSDIYYCYQPGGEAQWIVIYLLAGLLVPLGIQKMLIICREKVKITYFTQIRQWLHREKAGIIRKESLNASEAVSYTHLVKVIIELEAFDFKQAEENSDQVILIKLAERLHNMRTMEFMEKAEWKRRAEETMRLFLPMARRIENKKLIDELYDLSVKYL